MFKSQYQTNNSLNLPKREELLCNDECGLFVCQQQSNASMVKSLPFSTFACLDLSTSDLKPALDGATLDGAMNATLMIKSLGI